jgi:phosphatidylglycerol:prolipoprotein diacylglycerol transferase
MLVGIYLILAGVARFGEEGYRAEPQTAIICGLHSYQWLAVASVLAGMWSTTVASATASVGFALVSVPIVAASVAMAVITGLAMGVDLPQSSRRFSRLAPVD